ncbi:unnamed protein product [Clonostachys chloroleuca]|uniref:Uncharacterized protein n=1 Tax=Clonostachys chloroleuca TaxID=1926264 RepID=A0AA35MHW8_9HYPO|nr:unnamed protein product [Clonostachys chloroleuca]
MYPGSQRRWVTPGRLEWKRPPAKEQKSLHSPQSMLNRSIQVANKKTDMRAQLGVQLLVILSTLRADRDNDPEEEFASVVASNKIEQIG